MKDQNPYEASRVEIPTYFPRRREGSVALGIGSIIVGAVTMCISHSLLNKYASPQLLGDFAGPFFITYVLSIFAVTSIVTFIVGSRG
jgi:hypothetical protein